MRGTLLLLGVVATGMLSGCGGVYYAINMSAAESRLEQAREMGAEKQAPYEYYYAREHVREARLQAAEASYGDAANMAETAENYAQKAIDKMVATKRNSDPDKEKDKDEESSGWK